MGLILGQEVNIINQEVFCAVAPSLAEEVSMPPGIRSILKYIPESGITDNITDRENKELERSSIENGSTKEEYLGLEIGTKVQLVDISDENNNPSKAESFQKQKKECEDLEGEKIQEDFISMRDFCFIKKKYWKNL